MKRKRKPQERDREQASFPDSGFTLMELMVVVGILGIIMSVAVPSISQYRDRHQFSGAVLEVLASLRRARATAVETNRTVIFTFNVASGTYQAFVDNGAGSADLDGDGIPDNAGNNQWDAGEPSILSGALPRGVVFTSAAFGITNDSFFRFSGRGFPLGGNNALAGGSIGLAGNLGATRNVVLIASGHTRIQ
jgi:prepilin-type N-terminal cleavage/methylation domain-containing protein